MKLVFKIIFLLATLPIQAQISSIIYNGGPNRHISSGDHSGQGNRRSNQPYRPAELDWHISQPNYTQDEINRNNRNSDFRMLGNRIPEARTKIQKLDHREERGEILDYAEDAIDRGIELSNHFSFDEVHDLHSLALDLIDIATSVTPFVSNVRDIYEAITGRNLITGEEMLFGSFERNMAIVGAFTGPLLKSARSFDGFCTIIGRLNKTGELIPKKLRGETIEFAHNKVLSELKDTIGFLKRNGVKDKYYLRDFTDAFKPGAKTRVLTEDLKVYRYYNKARPGSNPRSNWVATKKINNPVEELALEFDGEYEMVEWIVPKGTEILEGIVASKWGRSGGAHQVFIDMKVLK